MMPWHTIDFTEILDRFRKMSIRSQLLILENRNASRQKKMPKGHTKRKMMKTLKRAVNGQPSLPRDRPVQLKVAMRWIDKLLYVKRRLSSILELISSKICFIRKKARFWGQELPEICFELHILGYQLGYQKKVRKTQSMKLLREAKSHHSQNFLFPIQ